MNIYRSILIYNDQCYNIKQIKNLLQLNNYPVILLDSFNNYNKEDFDNFRMYIIHIKQLDNYKSLLDSNTISAFLCMNDDDYNFICDYIPKVKIYDKVLIFKI